MMITDEFQHISDECVRTIRLMHAQAVKQVEAWDLPLPPQNPRESVPEQRPWPFPGEDGDALYRQVQRTPFLDEVPRRRSWFRS